MRICPTLCLDLEYDLSTFPELRGIGPPGEAWNMRSAEECDVNGPGTSFAPRAFLGSEPRFLVAAENCLGSLSDFKSLA